MLETHKNILFTLIPNIPHVTKGAKNCININNLHNSFHLLLLCRFILIFGKLTKFTQIIFSK